MKMQEGVRFFPIFWNRPEPGKRKRMFRCSAEEGNVFPGMELNFRVDIFGFGATLSSGKENGGDAMNLAELMRFGERKSGAVICLEPLHCAFVGDSPLKLAPDQFLHHGAFCCYHKTHQGLGECSRNKARSIEIARRGRAFSGCCPCGIWDLALPILWRGELTGVLYLGGFAGRPRPELYPQGYPRTAVTEARKRELLRLGNFIAEFIRIELERNRDSWPVRGDEVSYLALARHFIDQNYNLPIGLTDLAEQLRMNPNYLGGILKRAGGKTFRQLLNERRIHEAKLRIQLHVEESIQSIAAGCGFPDSNYFCSVFKKLTGCAPTVYRKRFQTSGFMENL